VIADRAGNVKEKNTGCEKTNTSSGIIDGVYVRNCGALECLMLKSSSSKSSHRSEAFQE